MQRHGEERTHPAKVDQRPGRRVARAVTLASWNISEVDDMFSANKASVGGTQGMRTRSQEIRVRRRHAPEGSRAQVLAVIGPQGAEEGLAQPQGLIQYRIEYRREVTGRGVDDLQYLGGRSLLLQCLARLGQEPSR